MVSEHSIIILFIMIFANLGFMKLTSNVLPQPTIYWTEIGLHGHKIQNIFQKLNALLYLNFKILLIIKTKHLPNQINMQHLFTSYQINSIIKIICLKILYRGI